MGIFDFFRPRAEVRLSDELRRTLARQAPKLNWMADMLRVAASEIESPAANWSKSFKISPTIVLKDVYTLTEFQTVTWVGIYIAAVSQAGVDYYGINMADINTADNPVVREGVIPTRHNSTAGKNQYPTGGLRMDKDDIIRVKSDSAIHAVDGLLLFNVPGFRRR